MAQAPQTFETFIASERDRLNKERDTLSAQIAEINSKLAGIDRELVAITAYENAKSGKVPAVSGGNAPARTRRAPSGPRGGKREAILAAVSAHTDGVTRAQLIEQLGAKGDKSAEQSISNALSALKKAGTIGAKDGKYMPL